MISKYFLWWIRLYYKETREDHNSFLTFQTRAHEGREEIKMGPSQLEKVAQKAKLWGKKLIFLKIKIISAKEREFKGSINPK